MRAKRRVPAPWRGHPAVSTASCGCGARLPLPKMSGPASLRSTTTGNLGNVGLYRDALYLTEFDDPPLPLPETGARW